MSGNTVGTLNVFASGTTVPHLDSNAIWSRSGEQADAWMQAVVNISSPALYSVNESLWHIFCAKCEFAPRGDKVEK